MSRIPQMLCCLGRLIDLNQSMKRAAVVGCGPQPISLKDLEANGYRVVGIEPVGDSASAALTYMGHSAEVLVGCAERLPLETHSQTLVIFESVLEHVDSTTLALAEAYRVLEPGGVLFVCTTNRLRFSLSRKNGEFRKRFYNWFPRIVKESYVFQHLHYNPRLANYSPRPAVHWFSFSDLCEMGRQAGFAQFYSPLDLIEPGDPGIKTGFLRRCLFRWGRYHPWIRAMALVHGGHEIFMIKRRS